MHGTQTGTTVTSYGAEFKRCLEECDVPGVRALWAHVAPHLPQPRDDEEALASLHGARTYSPAIVFWKRAYSHAWLTERGLPSGLPDHLRPRAERLYPRVVDAVGIAVSARVPGLALRVRDAMSAAVEECYFEGRKAPEFVRARMREAWLKAVKSG
jgi:hypothetical protein